MDTGNIELLKLQWSENLTSSIFKVIFLTVVLLIVFILTFQFANFEEIIKNWSRYRCNPAFMPFAGMAGYDAGENFQFCLNAAFGDKAKELFAPIFALIANFVQILKLIVDVAMGLRQMFSNFFLSMNGFMRNVRDRIQALLFQVRLSFLKMQSLMGKVHATMFSVVFMGMSAITAGMNLSDNSLVNFVLEFCFDPNTKVPLESGEVVAISEIKVGDILKGNKQVLSTFVFDGSKTPMVKLQDVILSSEHMVQGPSGSWLLAKDHPDSVLHPSIPTLICLNVEGHSFELANGLVVKDYDETESNHVISAAQTIAQSSLNSSSEPSLVDSICPTSLDYSLGVCPHSEVLLNDDTWVPLSSVKPGGILYGNNPVSGIVQEFCKITGFLHGIECSSSQLVHMDNNWVRAGRIVNTSVTNKTLLQLITRNIGPLVIRNPETKKELWIRDYREVPVSEMEDVYRKEILKN